MTSGRSGKKANIVIDAIVVIIAVLVFSILSIFGWKVLNELNTDIQADADLQTETKVISGELNASYPTLFDNMIAFIFGLLMIFGVISVFMLDTHPIFFIVTMVLIVLSVGVIMILGNFYDDIMGDSDIASYANDFTQTSWFFRNIAGIFIAYAFLIGTMTFIKFRSAG